MTIFAVVTPEKNEKLTQKLVATFEEENVFQLDDHLTMFSSSDVTSSDVLAKLGGDAASFGKHIIFAISSYQGFQSQALWLWIKSKGL